jgi:transposase
VLPERTQEALEAYFDTWSVEQREAIQEVAIDLWLPYRLAVEAKLPNARINGDRFHVMKNLTDRITAARREIQRAASDEEKKQLKGFRWILVKNPENLNEQEKAKLDEMYAASSTLKQLHELKEEFRSIFETAPDPTTAAKRLQEWITAVEQSGLRSLLPFLTTLRNWWDAILNYFHEHITSGLVEDLNNKIKLIKRLAYGYRNFDHFRLRLLVECDGTT